MIKIMPSHAERRVVPYAPEQMFDLVADIERYPEFLPWCLSARIRERRGDTLVADMVVGFKMFSERFTTIDVLEWPRRIDVTFSSGPFKYLDNHWTFEPAGDGCLIDFDIDFELRSRLLQAMIGAVFGEAVRHMVGAFEKRARALYG